MVKNWKVSTKLIAIVIVPIMALIALTVVGVLDRTEQANQASRVIELIDFAEKSNDLVNQIETEGVYSVAYMASEHAVGGDELAEQRKKTDEAGAAFTAAVEQVGFSSDGSDSSTPEEVAQALGSVEENLPNLATARTSVDDDITPPPNTIESYGDSADAVLGLNAAIAATIEQPDLARNFTTFTTTESWGLASARKAMLSTAVTQTGMFPEQWPSVQGGESGVPCAQTLINCDAADLIGEYSNQAAIAETIFTNQASREQKQKERTVTPDAELNRTSKALQDAADENVTVLDQDGSVDPNLVPQTALDRSLASIGKFGELEGLFLGDTRASAEQIQSDANSESTLFIAISLVAIAVSVAGAALVARATSRPLKKLTGAAYVLSTEKLPALVERLRNPEAADDVSLRETLTPIDIDSKDEIGQLADAFNSIQQVTIEVAEEQSVLLRKGIGDIFINLARRNQTLLDRQIEFIDQLEANEEDPDQLDNLFKLDHLATRMRRNAESLLVLAGAEPPRRRGRPVALADVVRVAIGEVEDFARIQLLALDEATVGGNVAVDLAHLLSELMENATHFSPPDTMVEVVGHGGDAGTYVISVTDQGIGMSADQIAEANHQLANPPLVGLALSRSLGFIVVGRLAQRFDIDVKLTAAPSGGVTALATLPTDVVTFEGDEERESPADEGDVAVLDEEPETPSSPVEVAEIDLDEGADDLIDDLLDESVELELPTDEEFDRGLQELVDEETPVQDSTEPEQEQIAVPESVVEEPVVEEPVVEDAVVEEPILDEPVLEEAIIDEALAEPEIVAPEPEIEEPAVAQPGITLAEEIAQKSRAEAKSAELTAAGLVRRTPKKRADNAVGGGAPQMPARTTGSSQRSPEEVRKMLSRYRSGLSRGRGGSVQDSDDS